MARKKKILTKVDKLLKSLYYDPKSPSGFSSVKSLLEEAQKKLERQKNKRLKITKDKVVRFLQDQPTYTLHKTPRKKFPRRRVIVSAPMLQFQSDLMDMSAFAKYNDDYRWLMVNIDVFSKFGYGTPVKRKDAQHMVLAFKDLFSKTDPPKKLQTDKGKEYLNKLVQEYLKEKGVHHFTAENVETKAQIAERFLKTIKHKIYRYFTANDTKRWIDVFPELIHSYNHSVHSSHSFKPVDARLPENLAQVRWNLYGPNSRLALKSKGGRRDIKPPLFKPSDKVKLSKYALVFDTGYTPNWTIEPFIITEVLPTFPVTYKIKDLKNREIKGTFYSFELQRITNFEEVYKIKDILEEKGDKVLVRWEGFPDDFQSWVHRSNLIK